jgi:hypothetical protein
VIFRGWTALVMAAILAMFVGRESLGAMIGVARPIVIVTGAVAALAVAACLYWGLRGRMARAMAPVSRLRERLLDRGEAFADLAMLGILLAASFPVVAVINELGTEAQSLYFWSQVHGRSLGILRPALMLGLACLVVRRLEAASGSRPALFRVLAFGTVALLPGIVDVSRLDRHPIARIERQARLLDDAVGPAVDWTAVAARSEPEIYYAIARTMVIGR